VTSAAGHRWRAISWATRVLPPQVAATGPAWLLWTLALAAAIALILGVDLLAPNQSGAGALVVIPVLAASWTLNTRAVLGLLALVAAIEVAAVVAGRLGPLMVGGRLVSVAVVAVVGTAAALSLAEARRARQQLQAEGVAGSYLGRLEQAIEAAEDIGAAGELEDVTERVLRRAVECLRADRGSISRLEGDELVLEHDHRPMGSYPKPGSRRALSRSRMAATAIRTRQPVHGRIVEGSVGPDGMAWLVRAGLRYAIQCPLVVEDEVVGVLGIARTRDIPFTDADAAGLQPFATLAALLLRNARRLAAARQTGLARSHFMTLAAHELRTPLAVVRGYLSLLEDGTYPVPDRTRVEAVETLVSKAGELESLVDSLVMAARLEGGTLPRVVVELGMADEVREAVERLRPRARLEGARVTVEKQGRGPVAMADRSHVARILDNLLNNALTYSPAPADVAVEVRRGDPVEVAVSDAGHGIPPEQHERVFERFQRVDVGPTVTVAGLGLGLAISRELARLNGGHLVLERSTPGHGSTFVLRLPS
jgi:signal transduction histidine kinase